MAGRPRSPRWPPSRPGARSTGSHGASGSATRASCGSSDQLEADGHVTRARGTPDRRTVNVTLTDSGWALAREIATARLSILREEVDALDPEDRAALDRICATVLSRRIDSLRAAERRAACASRTRAAILEVVR